MNNKILIIVIGGLILSILLFIYVGLSFGANVTDTAGGNKGYILVNDGTGQGHRGTWTDPTFLKGDKGDTGATGQQGIQGIKGNTGSQGIQGIKGDTGNIGQNGLNGIDGINGIDGVNGLNGIDGTKGDIGLTGDKGDKGDTGANGKDVDPATVNNLQNADTTLQSNINTETTTRKDGDTKLSDTINAKDITQTNWNKQQDNQLSNHEDRINNHDKRIGKLEETQVNVRGEVILQQGRRHKIGVYGKYNTNRNVIGEVGLSITMSLDDSYEMKEIDKLNSKIEKLQSLLEKQDIETETVKEGNKTIIRIKQKDGVIKVMNKF